MEPNFGGLQKEEQSEDVQSRTHIEFFNPRDPDNSIGYADSDTAQMYFDAADQAKEYNIDRRVLVGEFLVAMQSMVEEGSTDKMGELLETLTGQSVSFEDE